MREETKEVCEECGSDGVVEKTVFICDYCGSEYDVEEDALECENECTEEE